MNGCFQRHLRHRLPVRAQQPAHTRLQCRWFKRAYLARAAPFVHKTSEVSGSPVGVVAQIQDHKPGATEEKHCTVRPLVPAAIPIKLMPQHAPLKQWHVDSLFLRV